MAGRRGQQDGKEAVPRPVHLEAMEFLQFENYSLKIALAQRDLAEAEGKLEQLRAALTKRYGIAGSWRVDARLRALVPADGDARIVPPASASTEPSNAALSCAPEGNQHD